MGTLVTGNGVIPYVRTAVDLFTDVDKILTRLVGFVTSGYVNSNTTSTGGSVQSETITILADNFVVAKNLYQVIRNKASDGNEHYTYLLDEEISRLKLCLDSSQVIYDLWFVGAVRVATFPEVPSPPGPPQLPITIVGDPSVVPNQLPNGWVVYEFRTTGLGNIIIENSDGNNPLKTYPAQVFIVGGGGGGGGGFDAQFGIGGGGGASVPQLVNFTLTQPQLVLTVGAGGKGQEDGDGIGFPGEDSTFSATVPAVPQSTTTSYGGRYGGVGSSAGQNSDPLILSCGGGGGGTNGAGGTGQQSGGSGSFLEGEYIAGGGGGGTRSAGQAAFENQAGDGGQGNKTRTISGLVYSNGSGGGGGYAGDPSAPGAGGVFFDTNGNYTYNTNDGGGPGEDGKVGIANTGLGGGGAGIWDARTTKGGDGSSGIVVFAFKFF